MCGIVSYIGRRESVPILLEGLQQLEYRGYDSAGLAVMNGGQLHVHKAKGKVRELTGSVPQGFSGKVGIGHTRWATHGAPSDINAHPHLDPTGRVAVVHNGVIENVRALKAELESKGAVFVSQTDTEVLAHLIANACSEFELTLEDGVRLVLNRVQGTYGIAVLDSQEPDHIVVARNGSPVVIGIGEHEMLIASDVAALVRHTQQVVFMDDGELATVSADAYRTSTLDAEPTTKTTLALDLKPSDFDRGSSTHYMDKEILEQPESIRSTLRGRIEHRFATAHLGGLNLTARELRGFRRVQILGCGSAFYAGMLGANLIESLVRLPARAEPASEFRYRDPVIDHDTLYIAVSQSGETLDTLGAVEEVKRRGGRVIGIVNAVGSSMARACDGGIYLHAGPEISVASTKAFTSTGVAFALLALYLGRIRDLSSARAERLLGALEELPNLVGSMLEAEDQIREVAKRYQDAQSMFFIGRGRCYPVALEGAQKLKEISYIHAEAYPASELKHGPLALINAELPTLALVPDDELMDKNAIAVEQIRARGGPVIVVGHEGVQSLGDSAIVVPKSETELDPIVLTIPLQLLAYHTAVELGRDIDQPRNLAKSVTVE